MKRKIYKLFSGAKQGFCAIALILLSGKVHSQTTYTFNFTGGQQTIALQAGSYSVQCWGAKGESAVNQPTGGVGGYSAGTFSLSSTTTVYVVVGGKGSLGLSSAAFANGGYNGGGQGYGSTVIGAGGGGASHLATAPGTLATLVSNTTAIIVVAGGGGGSGYAGVGGHGGGSTGGNGNTGLGGNVGSPFGVGANGTTAGTCGGGGGGWYGGNLGSPGNTGGAGGGSGYIGGLTTGTTVQSGQTGFVSTPVVSGDGLVLITELCSINLYAAGNTNSLNPILCSGQSATLMTNAISNYSWSTGATTSSLVVSPTSNTVYVLTATSPSNCTTSRNISITVSSGIPVLSISNPSNNICLGRTVSLTATGAITYTWVNPGVVNGQTFTPSATAVYTVIGQNGCGTANATTTITVAPLAVTASAPSTLVCSGYPTTLTASSAVSNYSWQPIPVTGSLVVVTPTANTIFTVTASDGTCSGTATLNITTKVTPTITASATSATICQGLSTTLNALGAGTGGTYSWTPGGVGSQISVSPATSTIYIVMGTNTLNCTGQTQQIVIVENNPIFSVVANKTLVCTGQTVSLVASGNNISGYAWTNGPSTGTYTPIVTSAAVFTVTASHAANSCTATRTIAVSAVVPNVTFPGNTSVCLGSTATITASGATSYVINGLPNVTGTTTFQPQQNTTVTIIATTSSLTTNCPLTQTLLLSVDPLPTITVVPTRTAICKSETNTLTPSGAQSFTLTSVTGATSTGSSFVIAPTTSVIYTVTGTDSKGCVGELLIQVQVNSCTGLNEINFYEAALFVYPNPSNGTFMLKSFAPLDLTLVNELGQQLRSIQLQTSNGFSVEIKDLSPGIYFVFDKNSSVTARKIVVE